MSPAPSEKHLTERWRSDAGASLAAEIVARLVAGRGFDGLGLGETDGGVDLRGLVVPTPRQVQRFETNGLFVEELGNLILFEGVALSGLDLSGAHLPSLRFRGASLSECRFDRARCRDWRMWSTSVADCSFSNADLREGALGTWHDGRRNEWRRIAFTHADLRLRVSQAALYQDCDFTDANLSKVKFEQCTLVGCTFSGPMRAVVFDGRELIERVPPPRLQDVDYSGAMFDEVEFLGYRLGGVIAPNDPDVRLIRGYRCVVEHALAMLQGDESMPARMLRGEFQNRQRMMRTEDEDNFLNRRDYAGSDGGELADLAREVFGRAEAYCRR